MTSETPAGGGGDVDEPFVWTPERIHEAMLSSTNMNVAMGYEILEVSPGRCVGRVPFDLKLAQSRGIVHTGAMVTVADSTATWAAMSLTDPSMTRAPDKFPLAVQLSANILRNTDHGWLTATAVVRHGGRSMQVVETQVTDEDGRLLAIVTTTHMVVRR